jgi:glycosyltransferase involved in cell wall biosynthesis
MRILTLAHQWIPEHCAGAEVMLHGMLRALADRGHDVTVQLSRQEGERYDLDGVKVYPLPERRTSELIDGVDVLVTHLENTPRATYLGKWNDIPVVQVLHNTMQVTRRWLVREPIALAVHNSQWMLADYAAWCRIHGHELPRSLVVRPPVWAHEYATTPGDRITLINLRPDERNPDGEMFGKGAELFWELAKLLPDVQFLGVKGAYGEQLVYDLPNVEVLEHIPHDQMREKVYARTGVLLMPSSYESWGRTAVEAIASGIPVIAHPTPGLVEALGTAGLLLDRRDIAAWAEAIQTLGQEGHIYDMFSARSLHRSAELDPTEELNAWCEAVESLKG